MAGLTERDKVPFDSPQWLLKNAKKQSQPPSKALLARLQHAREHPDELAGKLREDAAQAGRGSSLLRRTAEMRQTAKPVQTSQWPKHVRAAVTLEEGEVAEDDVMTSAGPALTDRQFSQIRPATLPTKQSTLTSALVQRRVGSKGQVTKSTKPQIQSNQSVTRNKLHEMKTMKSGATSSTSSPSTPNRVDSPQYPSESSASGAIHEMLNATSRMLENQGTSVPPAVAQSYPFPTRPTMPSWYTSVSKQSQMQFKKRPPQEMAAIDALKDCIRRCINENDPVKLNKEINDLRDHVHKAEIRLDMCKVKVRCTLILTDMGLPRIFNEHANFPWDLKADAWHLYEKWMNEDFDRDILRGIDTIKGKDRNGDRINQAYREAHPKDPKTFGDNGAVLGQWWPSQLCAVRDGVHGAAQGGIYGDKDGGTYSIVLSSGGYHDRDDGDVIEYSGTEGSNFEIKAATQSMITSSKLGNHIRVLRSSQLPKSNQHRPSCGLRYDGLYQIKSYQEIDLEKQTYRFHLERIPGQEPIRSQGVTKRPTVFEEEAYQRCKGRI